ncbi:Endonuclease, Uma2 family (restriction endonuclease fold) [Granulicella rosea]|uniref:Endonuclease, Uma2 family (Restriction endonuclease fold) n=1 Tax=Granulicella rosea TaxID=474952 RepID=A0A239DPJ8_9BACT|nr:Uma2 family endonuclease [Granulicella rosea]SNS33682.1 Endonuclease, Uma2 family (restriction endonuclease fold) [Granulicella rosea]
MATTALISVSEYLNTTYRPDRDYIDGEVRERNLGERPHAMLQMVLSVIFAQNRNLWNVLPLPEQRVQTSATHFRIPDLCIVRRSDPADRIVYTAPLLCIEVLSRDDTLGDMQERVDDYVGMGVENVWVIDPVRRTAYMSNSSGFVMPANGELTVTGTPIRVVLAELFAQVDEFEAGR